MELQYVKWGKNKNLLPLRIFDRSEENTGPVGDNSMKKKREDNKRTSNDIEEDQKREILFEDKVENLD